ncbi:actin-associated protein FAM107A [Cololabis saira]|uniref:actin-associated protein FAM107A n=1 Tax=Cololabis saira TaxID=129043 RepID=UPI002AD2FAB5|nr:actin-associated protein FAM107A [Cololabis saira]
MGVTHGKKRELQHCPRAHRNQSVSMMRMHQNEQHSEFPKLQSPSEEEKSTLIRPQKPVCPLTASRSHQELHKELWMSHRRRVAKEGKTELQRALEQRKWEQRMAARRDQEEAKWNMSPLNQELLKRQWRLENLEREEKSKQEAPEFIQVKERLRRTTGLNVTGK